MESLRHSCSKQFKLEDSAEKAQWEKLGEVTKFKAEDVADIRTMSMRVRHGEIVPLSSDQGAALFLKTWAVVDAFIDNA